MIAEGGWWLEHPKKYEYVNLAGVGYIVLQTETVLDIQQHQSLIQMYKKSPPMDLFIRKYNANILGRA